jgi:hypothetical protein
MVQYQTFGALLLFILALFLIWIVGVTVEWLKHRKRKKESENNAT